MNCSSVIKKQFQLRCRANQPSPCRAYKIYSKIIQMWKLPHMRTHTHKYIEWGTLFAGCIISQPESMQRHLFAFSICSPPAATAAEGVASMWVCCMCVLCGCMRAVSSVFAFLTLLITICHALDATAAVAAVAEMHQQQINKQHTPKYWQNTPHTHIEMLTLLPPDALFLLFA